MMILTRWGALLVLAAAAAACEGRATAVADPPQVAGHYCHVDALSRAEWQRLEGELVPRLVAATFGRDELSDGYAFHIHGSFAELGAWLDAVHRCCPSLAYELDLAPQLGDATLRITGADNAKPFIREEFAKLFADRS
jgi:hypothetical protein